MTSSEYFKEWKFLKDKKTKLYGAGNFKDWGIDPKKYRIDLKTLKSNKLIACHLMLPK